VRQGALLWHPANLHTERAYEFPCVRGSSTGYRESDVALRDWLDAIYSAGERD
jgi:hypothetical protein